MAQLTDRIAPRRIVVVGGGIAALEAVLALHDLGEAQFAVTLIAPEPDFTLRPLSVALPFARGAAGTLDLDAFMRDHGGTFRRTAVLGVDAQGRRVVCATGPDEPYDELVVAIGAVARPALPRALTFGSDPFPLTGLLADLEQGWSSSVAFVVPRGCTWPLPIYELALQTAEEVYGMNIADVDLHVVSPELTPLDVFGAVASAEVAELLRAAGIRFHGGVSASVEGAGRLALGHDHELHVERIVALPVLDGPSLEGLPHDADGFIPVDDRGRVVGVPHVHAVGDATTHRIKQGGLACQQADVAAADIAAQAGAAVDPAPYAPVLRGRLLTGRRDRFLRRDTAATPASDVPASQATDEPLWWPPAKVSGRYLGPFLAARALVDLPLRDHPGDPGIDVRLPLAWADNVPKRLPAR